MSWTASLWWCQMVVMMMMMMMMMIMLLTADFSQNNLLQQILTLSHYLFKPTTFIREDTDQHHAFDKVMNSVLCVCNLRKVSNFKQNDTS